MCVCVCVDRREFGCEVVVTTVLLIRKKKKKSMGVSCVKGRGGRSASSKTHSV